MVLNRQRRVLVSVAPLVTFLDSVRRELRFPEDSVTVRLISETNMARLNRVFRGKHGPTDVLSFPANKSKPRKAPRTPRGRRQNRTFRHALRDLYVGDIAISPATARRNAVLYSRPLSQELRILILHGMIHLAGYDHETDSGEMIRLEGRMRRQFGLTSQGRPKAQ
jgi:probable rRNA maturation factor